MTTILRFPTEEALRVAITSSLLADPSAPAWGLRTSDGAFLVQPTTPPDETSLVALRGLGLTVETDAMPPGARRLSTWAELVPLRRLSQDAAGDGCVLFVLRDGKAMLETAAELLRLGCDRVEVRGVEGGFWLRVVAPPYYTFARALDRAGGLTAFVPVGPEPSRVYVEAGYAHPLAALLRPEPGRVLLLAARGPWVSAADEAWSDLYSLVDLDVRGETVRHASKADLPRLRVTVRLARGGGDATPSLWVLREEGIQRMESLLASVPEEAAAGLDFAVADGERPTVVLRRRASARSGGALDPGGEAFRTHGQIPNLFLPVGWSLEPPLRISRLQELFAANPDAIAWVSAAGAGLRVERTDERAFRPLTEWTDYVMDRDAKVLGHWVRSATFAFGEFELEERPRAAERPGPRMAAPPPLPPEAGESPVSPEDTPKPRRGRKKAAPPKRALAKDDQVPEVPEPAPPVADGAADADLAATERELLAPSGPGDDAARTALWATLGRAYARAGRAKDAALAWTRALWESPPEEAKAVALAWRTAEGNQDPGALLSLERPSRDDVSAVAAALVSASLGDARSPGVDLARATVWLDRFDEVLDVRSMWLARSSLARLTGGDPLGLARARDRVVTRLRHGLSVERDVPTFLRSVAGTRDSDQLRRIGGCLADLAERCDRTKRARSAVEGDPKLTGAYLRLVIAYACARVGQVDRARAYAEAGRTALDLEDPIHAFLVRAFLARIDQATQALAVETALPPELAGTLNALDKLSRYKVDRVRQFSKILEPHERLDPVAGFQRGEEDPRGADFGALRGTSNVAAIEEGVERILAKARASDAGERAALFDGVMDFFPLLPSDRVVVHLEEIAASLDGIPAMRRALLLEEALMLAAHVGDVDLAGRIFGPLGTLIAGMDIEGVAQIASAASGMLRSLRRFGLREEARSLLLAMQGAASGKATPARIVRVVGAGALSYLGDFEHARPAFDEVASALEGDMPVPARLELTRALARAVAQAPTEYALSVLKQLAAKIGVVTDSFNTNSHVCVSVLAYVESIALGYASDDLTLDEPQRRWLDEDEWLVRRRVRKDMAST